MYKIHNKYPLYRVFDTGEVFSKLTNKILKPIVGNNYGHLCYNLSGDNGVERVYAHRLVLEVYIGHCPTGYECNHINSNPKDNRVVNLEWVTRSNNQIHSVIQGKHKVNYLPKKKAIKDTIIVEIQLKADKKPVARWKGQAYTNERGKLMEELAVEYKVSKSTILRIARREGVYNV